MTAVLDRQRAVRRNLLASGATLAGGAGLAAAYHVAGVGVPCPFLALTGWWCPLCGGTRMAAAVLDGHWASAFHWNPVAFVLVAGLGLRVIGWLVEWAGGPRVRLADRGFLGRLDARGWILLVVVLAVSWTLVRNPVRLA